jgi:hypothetical protein
MNTEQKPETSPANIRSNDLPEYEWGGSKVRGYMAAR